MTTISPLAPTSFPKLPPLAGVTFVTHACGIRYQDRTDLLFVELASGTKVGGVLTRSLTASAPVEWCRMGLVKGKARGLVVNSGNSNAFTGKAGMESVKRTAAKGAEVLDCKPHEVFISSTGTIGVPLEDGKITAALPSLRSKMAGNDWLGMAKAIMTTDTYPKLATRSAEIDGVKVTINGVAKGSGMIAPDMATMLAYVFTDANLPADVVQTLVAKGADKSFNCVTVDGDTSTSDTLLLFATGQAKHKKVESAADPRLKAFKKALDEVFLELTLHLAKDGEGASKLVTVKVTGAQSAKAAKKIAFAIANSPLVKTAIAGEDANWGRIVMAVGKSGEKADRDKLAISIGGFPITADGAVIPGYDETPVVAHMKGQEIEIAVDVGVGRGKCTVWTCDLTHGYIDINGSYRT
jgi:glutamate N-acetyltransferase/amino-acid N-acetyltransferase